MHNVNETDSRTLDNLERTAERLVRAIATLDVPGLSAVAGIAALSTSLTADEVFRRAALSLTSARQVGPGAVIRYREPLA